jgi:hypothetical protein
MNRLIGPQWRVHLLPWVAALIALHMLGQPLLCIIHCGPWSEHQHHALHQHHCMAGLPEQGQPPHTIVPPFWPGLLAHATLALIALALVAALRLTAPLRLITAPLPPPTPPPRRAA